MFTSPISFEAGGVELCGNKHQAAHSRSRRGFDVAQAHPVPPDFGGIFDAIFCEMISALSGYAMNENVYAERMYKWEHASGKAKGTEVLTKHFEKLSNPESLQKNWNHISEDGKTSLA